LEHDLFPFIGQMPVSAIKPRDILGVIQRVEARGAVDSAHRIKQVCGQILRYGVAIGWAERDVTDLKGPWSPYHERILRQSPNRKNWLACCVRCTPITAIWWP
jgi:hypothetical protein